MFLFWLIPLLALLGFFGLILYRANRFTPKAQPKICEEQIDFDRDSAVSALQTLIRFKTVSYRNGALEDDAEFEKLIAALPGLYPSVMNTCELKKLPDRALLFRWRGKNEGAPAVMMAHYDVVPIDEEGWELPAFEGIIKDGCLWGRGALDTKVTFNGILFSADHLIAEGFTPEYDIYFAFSGGEEVNGR
ncbi:MAG: M20/M25/M40 family metallo-hydrolase, partial [Clostridia bacterium]|nr:M20/M25/M40 family metallo-hydrolase [Clostridia bacterium]